MATVKLTDWETLASAALVRLSDMGLLHVKHGKVIWSFPS